MKIVLIVCLFLCSFSIAKPDNFRISYPAYIPKSTSFQVSILTHKDFPTAEALVLYIMPGDFLNLNKIELKFDGYSESIETNLILLPDYSRYAYKCEIDLTNPELSFTETYFQVLLKFMSSNLLNSKIEFFGEFKERDFILGYLYNSNPELQTNEPNIYGFNIDFYKNSNLAGESCQFNQNSFIEIPLSVNSNKKLLTEFWIKINGPVGKFLSVFDEVTHRELYQLYVNDYQVLTAESDLFGLKNLHPCFLSRNAWYHLSISLSNDAGYTKFYCNGLEFAMMDLPQQLGEEPLVLKLFNKTKSSSYQVDQLRIYNLEGAPVHTFKNRTFVSSLADSSRVLMQLNCSTDEIEISGNRSLLKYQGIKYVKSDAPLFPRAPELNITVMNNYYELEWGGGDYKSAKIYILEKAEGNSDFVEVFRLNAENEIEKTYSYLTEKVDLSEVVFFRVKQINKDASEVISAQVKVGQGIIEDIILGQNYPNPFNPVTRIEFELLLDSEVEVKVYNLEGEEVALLYSGFLSRGIHQYEFDGGQLPSGIYLYKVSTPQFTQTRKMILAK